MQEKSMIQERQVKEEKDELKKGWRDFQKDIARKDSKSTAIRRMYN